MRLLTLALYGLCLLQAAGCYSSVQKAEDPDTKFVLGMSLGQSEAKWTEQYHLLINTTVFKPYELYGIKYHRYRWPLKDTIITVDVSLSGSKGLMSGHLQTVHLSLETLKAKGVDPNDEEPIGFTTEGMVSNKVCSQRAFTLIKQYLDEKYGKPDSVYNATTKETTFTYEKDAYTILLWNLCPNEPDDRIPVPYFNNAQLNISLKDKQP